MEKERNNKLVFLGVAALLLLGSLPTTWMTIKNAAITFDGGFTMPGLPMGGMTLAVTGANGSITLAGAKLPIWLIVGISLAGLLLAGLNIARVCSLPRFVPMIPYGIGALFVIAALVTAVGSSDASLGLGVFLAIAGIAAAGYPVFSRLPTASGN